MGWPWPGTTTFVSNMSTSHLDHITVGYWGNKNAYFICLVTHRIRKLYVLLRQTNYTSLHVWHDMAESWLGYPWPVSQFPLECAGWHKPECCEHLKRDWHSVVSAVLLSNAGPNTAHRSKRTACGSRKWLISHSSLLASGSCWSLKFHPLRIDPFATSSNSAKAAIVRHNTCLYIPIY